MATNSNWNTYVKNSASSHATCLLVWKTLLSPLQEKRVYSRAHYRGSESLSLPQIWLLKIIITADCLFVGLCIITFHPFLQISCVNRSSKYSCTMTGRLCLSMLLQIQWIYLQRLFLWPFPLRYSLRGIQQWTLNFQAMILDFRITTQDSMPDFCWKQEVKHTNHLGL